MLFLVTEGVVKGALFLFLHLRCFDRSVEFGGSFAEFALHRGCLNYLVRAVLGVVSSDYR